MNDPLALWVTPVSNLAGVARHILDVAKVGLPGWRLVVTAPEGPLLERLRELDCPVIPLPIDGASTVRSVAALRQTLTRLRPTVAHSHLAKADILLSLASVGLPVTLVTTEHHIPPDRFMFHKSLPRALAMETVHRARLTRFAQAIAVSDSTRRDMRRYWHTRTPISVILNGVDRPTSPSDRKPGLRLLSLTRLSPEKNLDMTLRVFARVLGPCPEATLTIAGTGEDEQRLRGAAVALGIADRVHFAGFVDPDEAMASHDVLLQPSKSDNCSYTLLDAAAQGMGVAASPIGGNPEILPPHCIAELDDDEGMARIAIEQGLELGRRPILPDIVPTVAAMARKVGEIYRPCLPATQEPPSDASSRLPNPRVAIVHDYLTQRGGAERVVLNLSDAFPDAPIVTSLHNPQTTYPEFSERRVITSPLNRVGLLRDHFRLGLPLYGWAFDRAGVPVGTEVVVASTTGFAHGVRTAPGIRKLVYCHSPARFLYLADDYLGAPWWKTPTGWALSALRPALVHWDRKAVASADRYLCNSTLVRQRIKDVYGIDATVVHPPSGLDPKDPQTPVRAIATWRDFYLVVSRLMPYKNIDIVLDAFRELPNKRLIVIGRGPLASQLRAIAPSNVRFLEGLSDNELRWAYANCRAVIAPSREDYGLTPVEGFGFGKPCLALRSGGYLDTVSEGVSGWFFDDATPGAIRAAVSKLEDHPLDVARILEHSSSFSAEAFARQIRHEVAELLGRETG